MFDSSETHLFCCPLLCPQRLCDLPNSLPHCHLGFFPRGKAKRIWSWLFTSIIRCGALLQGPLYTFMAWWIVREKLYFRQIWYFRGGDYGKYYLLECDPLLSSRILPTIQGNILPLSSGTKSKPSINQLYLLVICIGYFLELKTEAVSSAETPLNFYQITWRRIREDNTTFFLFRLSPDVEFTSDSAAWWRFPNCGAGRGWVSQPASKLALLRNTAPLILLLAFSVCQIGAERAIGPTFKFYFAMCPVCNSGLFVVAYVQ
jgi:hypothetical protein